MVTPNVVIPTKQTVVVEGMKALEGGGTTTGVNAGIVAEVSTLTNKTSATKSNRKKGTYYYDLKESGTKEERDTLDLINQTGTGFDDDKPVEHLEDWMQEVCHKVMKETFWPRLKLLSDTPSYDLRSNKVLHVMFVRLGWDGNEVEKRDYRRLYWRAVEKYCIFWMQYVGKKVDKNVRTELNRTSKWFHYVFLCRDY